MTRTVAVLMGGWSPEREVSLVSGRACAEGLREGGHAVVEYDVKRDLRALVEFLRPTAGGGPDVVFNALHGRYGEDGCIQGVLEILAMPYTHSGVLASAIAMDKPLARHVFASLGLRVADGRVIERRSLAAGGRAEADGRRLTSGGRRATLSDVHSATHPPPILSAAMCASRVGRPSGGRAVISMHACMRVPCRLSNRRARGRYPGGKGEY